ncbi:RAD52 motif-containing protein 1-like [Oncorhynchus nerka]|uniref:RAD52 motif-containing protein 1-like n=1 Tax=Oncorhynchus nerka TaxID=8023 RepID=UPI0031B897C4
MEMLDRYNERTRRMRVSGVEEYGRVPIENIKTLFVWNILSTFSEAFIYVSLINVFCNFGPLYLVKVCPNAALVEPGFYAPVKYFSAAKASKAQRATHGRGFLQSSPLKVKLSTKQYPNFLHNSKPLSHSKCQDFANHYMGFNGWRTHIVTVNDIPWSQFDPDGQEENEDIPWELSVNM